MAQRKVIADRGASDRERSQAFEELREIQRQLWEASQDLSDEERDAIVREITDVIDDAIRRKVLALRTPSTD